MMTPEEFIDAVFSGRLNKAEAREKILEWKWSPKYHGPHVFYDVLQFMKIGHEDKVNFKPTLSVPKDVEDLCLRLIKEELKELADAYVKEDLVEASDALADLIYVLIFAAHCYGIPLETVWEEVQRTNMAKFPDGKVLRDEGGKVVKPEGWQPPDIKKILEDHGWSGGS